MIWQTRIMRFPLSRWVCNPLNFSPDFCRGFSCHHTKPTSAFFVDHSASPIIGNTVGSNTTATTASETRH